MRYIAGDFEMETNSEELRLGIVALTLFASYTVLLLEHWYRATRVNRLVVSRSQRHEKRDRWRADRRENNDD
jgi:hypothetical protein